MRQIFTDKKKCFGCGSCAAVCTAQAITMQRDEEGFLYPVVQEDCCMDCGMCQDICPAKRPMKQVEGSFYAVRCKDEELLQKSTSGGAFSLLAREIKKQGGLVCGACFDDKFQVKHVLSEETGAMRKSKYVQSDIGDCFLQVRNTLAGGKAVLFTGTPCQCHAMKLYCGEYGDKLAIAALICRGVQSPGLWEDYVSWLGSDMPLEAYDFRDKRLPNNGHTLSYTVGGIEKAVPWGKDRLCRIYNRCLTYRPSCYACPYCTPDNDFDFIMGDFWGIEKIHPEELADGKGTSLVIAHGAKAEGIMERIASQAVVLTCGRTEALQPALVSPAKEHMLRRFLFKDYAKKDEKGRCDIPLILKKYSMVS